MAKRAPPHETPYRPVDDALVRAVLNPEPAAPDPGEYHPPAPPKLVGIQGRKDAQPAPEPPAAPAAEKLTREKRVLLTPTEEWELDRLVADMAAQLRTPLKPSHVLRAVVTLLQHAGDELVKQSRRVGPLKRPANNDAVGLAAFEHYLAQVIDSALRNAAHFR